MSNGSPWVITQLGGPKKVLTLAGYDAPFGRPRQKAVVRDKIKVRSDRVYYAGNNEPTRHIFGDRFEDWELNGRFSDRVGGNDYARVKTEFVRGFVADKQPVRVTWGSLLSVRGFITEFDPGRESSGEVEWRAVIEIDGDDLMARSKKQVDTVAQTPLEMALTIQNLLAGASALPKTPVTLKGNIFDFIDSLVSLVNSGTAALVAVADQIGDFEKAAVGEVRRFRAGISQVKTSLIKLRAGYDGMTTDLAVQSERTQDWTEFWHVQADNGSATLTALLALDDADRAAAIAERGKVQALYTAGFGDTWESISAKLYGSADRAADIRAANGIASGSAPVAGTIYQIPA